MNKSMEVTNMLNNAIPYTMPVAPACGSNNDGFFGGEGIWAVIIFALIFGWGRGNGGLFGGGNGSGISDGYVLSSDFATIQRQLSDGFNSIDNALDRQNAGICDLGYTNLSLNNQTNMNMMSGFNATQAQLASCCCDIREGIQANTTQGVMNTNAIQQQIQQCCCDNEKLQLQNKFDAAQANCATLQAIDKVGDRIIDYMAAEKAQSLRDENQALRLRASQEAQNNYLISQLRPFPVASYSVPNPFTGCGCGCNNNYYN